MAGLTGGGLFLADQARADALSKELRDKLTPDQIIQTMKKGNKRFRAGERKDRNYLRTEGEREGTVSSGRLADVHRLARAGRGHHGPWNWRHLQLGSRGTSETQTFSAVWSSRANWQVRKWYL
jgi:hypothetical protein